MATIDEELPGEIATGRLLVVDDDEYNRDLLARRLERRGHSVWSADGGRRALEMIGRYDFDLVLLDVMMPEIGGLDVLRQVRRNFGPAELPVIMATARNQSEDIVEALRLGANDYVTKPLDFPVVLARVQAQLTLKQAVEAAARLERQLAERNRELEFLNGRLQSANRRMGKDLRAAAKIQATFLPVKSPALPGARCGWYYGPCEELAGDGLNAFPLGGGRSAFYVFDVCGHGVAASLLSVSISRVLSPPGDASSVLNAATVGPDVDSIRQGPSSAASIPAGPAEVADRLNRMFPFDQADQYFTMVYGILEPVAGPSGGARMRFVSAGHPGILHLKMNGEASVLDGRGFPVGLATSPYDENTLELAKGDRVVVYSDGLTEALDTSGRAFGIERVVSTLESHRGETLELSLESLVTAVNDWCGEAGRRDDVSILAFEVD